MTNQEKQNMWFGKINLPIIPSSDPNSFIPSIKGFLPDFDQKVLLDNLWQSANDRKKFKASMTALCYYFQKENKNKKIKKSQKDFPSAPTFSSEKVRQLSIQLSQHSLRYESLSENYHHLQNRLGIFTKCLSEQNASTSIAQLIEENSRLNNLLKEIERTFVTFSTFQKPLQIENGFFRRVRKNQFSTNLSKARMFFKHREELSSLPDEIKAHIYHKWVDSEYEDFIKILSALNKISMENWNIQGLTIYRHTELYPIGDDNPDSMYFSIPFVCLDLSEYQTIKIDQVQLTPQKLMDYGLLRELIISEPEQTDQFGRYLASLTCHELTRFRFVLVTILSKPPEWFTSGFFDPAKHMIRISGFTIHPRLIDLDDKEMCFKPYNVQIMFWTIFSVAKYFTTYMIDHKDQIAENTTQKFFGSFKTCLPFRVHSMWSDDIITTATSTLTKRLKKEPSQ